jgi:hypothetical protein
VARLSDAELARSTPNGWTVAATLAHLASGDERAAALLQRWAASGVSASPADADAINAAILPLCTAPPRAAAELALRAAEAADHAVAEFPDALVPAAEQMAPFRLRRGHHRAEHLDEIEALLKGRHPNETQMNTDAHGWAITKWGVTSRRVGTTHGARGQSVFIRVHPCSSVVSPG